jgi:hypothetical protein
MQRSGLAAGAALAVAGWLAASHVLAQDVGEVIVTAEKRSNIAPGLPEAFRGQPHVVIFRRADNLVVEVQVDCDTRDQKDRFAEMKSTLRNMISAAGVGSQIELGVESGAVILPLKPEALDTMLGPGDRDDTTTTTIVVKSHVSTTDTFEAASARIEAFILNTRTVGRTQVARRGDWQLTLITPRQYRPQIVAAIAQDADDTRKAFGASYAVEVEGLEHPVAWNRSGPLDLALFIPYALKIEPAPAR